VTRDEPNSWEVADVIERRVSLAGLAAMLLLTTHAAWGKLPPPTEAEAQAKKAAADKKVKDEEAAKQALAKAQDRVAARYQKSGKRK
jgi:hypothetical protein